MNFKNASSKYIIQYTKKLKKILIITGQPERKYLKRLRQQLEEYADDFSINSYEDLVRQFGPPQEVAASYYKNIDENQLLQRLKFKKYIVRCTIFIFLCISFYSIYSHILIQSAIEYGETVDVKQIILPPVYHRITNK